MVGVSWRPYRPTSHLVGVFELETGDDQSLQLSVSCGLVQDALAELGDVGLTGLPQHWVQPVVYTRTQIGRRYREVPQVNQTISPPFIQ